MLSSGGSSGSFYLGGRGEGWDSECIDMRGPGLENSSEGCKASQQPVFVILGLDPLQF